MTQSQDDIAVSDAGVLNRHPLVLHAWWYQESPFPFIDAISTGMPSVPFLLLLSNAWSALSRWKNSWDFNTFVRDYRGHQTRYPHHQVLVMANDVAERQLLRVNGVDAVLFQHNGLMHLGDTPGDCLKDFDAVYVARIEAYKRIELAGEIRSGCLVFSSVDRDYFRSIEQVISHFVFANGHPLSAETRQLSRKEVAQWCLRSRCGLVLSNEEGANLASGEYMLCGLPVVSTRAIGGRDEYYDEKFWVICEDDPASVCAAVREMISRRLDATAIRASFVSKVMERRSQLLQLILSRTAGWSGSLEPFIRDWLTISTPFVEYQRWHSPLKLLNALG